MYTEFIELLRPSADDKTRIWIVGSRDQVQHTINEFYVKRITDDRAKFTPIVAAPFRGKFMSFLER